MVKGRRKKAGSLVFLMFITFILPIICLKNNPYPSNDPPASISPVRSEVLGISEGLRGWTRVEAIDPASTTTAEEPIILADTAGNLHLTWADGGIKYRYWNATMQCWGPIEVPSLEHSGQSYQPSIAVDGAGNVHLVWSDETNYSGAGNDLDVFYECRNAVTGLWSTTVVVSNGSAAPSTRPEIAVDGLDNIHIVWEDLWNYSGCGTDKDLLYRSWNTTSGEWTATEVITVESSEHSFLPSIAADPAGTVHLVWVEMTITLDPTYYKYRNATTNTWSTAEVISTESLGDTHLPKIAINTEGNLFVVWNENSALGSSGADEDLFYKWRNATSSLWTTTEVLTTESSVSSSQPAISTDMAGNIYVIWRDYEIFYKYYNITTRHWSTWELLSPESTGSVSKPTIAVDPMGYVHVAYEDQSDYNGTGTDMDIYYKRTMDLPAPPTLAPILPNPSTNGIIALNWSVAPAAAWYYIYRNTSPFSNVTGLVPLKKVLTNSCTDVIATPGNYSYAVVAGNAAGNSTPSNCETVQVLINDTQPPGYTGEAVRWSSPHSYAQGEVYQFNLTVRDDVAVDTVLFEWEGTNYTAETHVGAEYYYELADLGVSTYQYRWVFNDTADNWNATQPQSYVVTPSDPILDVRLNGTPTDLQIYRTQVCNVTVPLGVAGSVALYVNASLAQSGVAPLVNISRYTRAGVYNFTAVYVGSQNYSAIHLTRWLTVIPDLTPPQLAHTVNTTYLNCTVLEYQHTGLTLAVEVADNLQVDQVLLYANATGSFANRTMTPGIGDRYERTLDISSLAYGATLAYRFYANDTSGNANWTPLFQLSVHDFISPGPCILNYDPTYAPSFVLENTSFALSGGDDFGGAGVAAYQYRVGAGAWQAATAFNLTGYSNGFQTLAYRAVDGAGNNGTASNTTVYLLADAADYDGDGLTNGAELQLHFTDPLTADTDGDGFPDGAEVDQGTDPLDAGDNLLVRKRRLLVWVCMIGTLGLVTITTILYLKKK